MLLIHNCKLLTCYNKMKRQVNWRVTLQWRLYQVVCLFLDNMVQLKRTVKKSNNSWFVNSGLTLFGCSMGFVLTETQISPPLQIGSSLSYTFYLVKLKVRLIYSSNQSHEEAVLSDRLAYFLSLRNVSSLFVLFCSLVLFVFLSAALPLSLFELLCIYRPDVKDRWSASRANRSARPRWVVGDGNPVLGTLLIAVCQWPGFARNLPPGRGLGFLHNKDNERSLMPCSGYCTKEVSCFIRLRFKFLPL